MITELSEKAGIIENIKLSRIYDQFKELLDLLKQRELPLNIIEIINHDIEELNISPLIDTSLRKLFKQKQNRILKLLEKELKIVTKDHYKNLWLAIGPSVFGFPIGLALSSNFFDNMAFFIIGMPMGILIGMIIGSNMDKKAYNEGRQLDIIIKY